MNDSAVSCGVLSSYTNTERMLVDFLADVPFCHENEGVWSPVLVTVIMEACSQLDSLLKYEAHQSKKLQKDLSIVEYFIHFGDQLAPKWAVFWGEEPAQIQPFDGWSNRPKYSAEEYVKLDWWDAYTKLKHNRLENRSCANLHNAVRSLCALFLAILDAQFCWDAIAQAGWLTGNTLTPQEALREDPNAAFLHVCAETRLYAYPVGWMDRHVPKYTEWRSGCSQRFRDWFRQYANDQNP